MNRRPQVPQTCTLNPCAIARHIEISINGITLSNLCKKSLYVIIDTTYLKAKNTNDFGVLMKSEVIEDILNVEAEAEKIVSDANDRARDMIFTAQSKAKSLISKRVDEERAAGNKELEERNNALESALSEYEKERVRLEEASAVLPVDVIEKATKRVVDRIVSID